MDTSVIHVTMGLLAHCTQTKFNTILFLMLHTHLSIYMHACTIVTVVHTT